MLLLYFNYNLHYYFSCLWLDKPIEIISIENEYQLLWKNKIKIILLNTKKKYFNITNASSRKVHGQKRQPKIKLQEPNPIHTLHAKTQDGPKRKTSQNARQAKTDRINPLCHPYKNYLQKIMKKYLIYLRKIL